MSTRVAFWVGAVSVVSVLAAVDRAKGDDAGQLRADTEQSIPNSLVNVGDAARFAAVFEKARLGRPITVGFLGGSITAGYAAHDAAHRYVDLVAAWWKQNFPASTVTTINAGVGGTGSNFGCLRVQADLLDKKPDFVVVEFAVNDDDNRHSALTLEGVVRQVLAAPGSPACLLLFMSHDGKNAQRWHAQVGQHYDLPMVSYRDGLAAEIAAGRLKWTDISPDDIHPNDRGHAMAAKYVTSELDTLLKSAPKPAAAAANAPAAAPVAAAPLPAPLFTDLYQHVVTTNAAALKPMKNDGWTYDAKSGSWKSERVGSAIEFAVEGRGVDLMYYRVHRDMGRARVTVDGGHEQICDAWFAATWGGYRHTADIVTDLPPGPHVVRVEIIEDKAAQSKGHEFRIMGLSALGVDAGT